MKLATYRDGSRDGQLVVVSRDLALAHYASGMATRLQQVLDDWNFLSPQLEDLSQTLNHGKARHAFAFEPRMCMAPLPRAYRWVTGSAFASLVERLHAAHGAEVPAGLGTEPSMRRGSSDELLGPCDDIVCASVEGGLDFGAGLAVVTGDVAVGSTAGAAIDGIRLLMLVNDTSLRDPAPADLASAFGPVAVTPDELLPAWHGGRVHLDLKTTRNGQRIGLCNAADGMTFHFGELIADLCKTRSVRAGSIVGSGPVSSRDASCGCSCIAEKRALEAIEGGGAKTSFMQFGDTVRVEMKDANGASVFGAIEQRVVASLA